MVCAANGVTISTLGLCKVTIQIGDDFQSEFTFIESKHTNIPVLGMDWMTENATGWDFGTRKMCIQGVNRQLQSAASAKSCQKLVLA